MTTLRLSANTKRLTLWGPVFLIGNALTVWLGWRLLEIYIRAYLTNRHIPYFMMTVVVAGLIWSTLAVVLLVIGNGVVLYRLTRSKPLFLIFGLVAILMGILWFLWPGQKVVNNLVTQNLYLCQSDHRC